MKRHSYIDGDTLEAIRNAWACGVPLQKLAAQAGADEQALYRLLRSGGLVQGNLSDGQPDPGATISER